MALSDDDHLLITTVVEFLNDYNESNTCTVQHIVPDQKKYNFTYFVFEVNRPYRPPVTEPEPKRRKHENRQYFFRQVPPIPERPDTPEPYDPFKEVEQELIEGCRKMEEEYARMTGQPWPPAPWKPKESSMGSCQIDEKGDVDTENTTERSEKEDNCMCCGEKRCSSGKVHRCHRQYFENCY